MGTTYTVFEKRGLTVELDEGSSTFSIGLIIDPLRDHLVPSGGTRIVDSAYSTHEAVETTRNLTPADLVGLALEILKVASYFGFNDLGEHAKAYMAAKGIEAGYYEDVLKQLTGQGDD